MDFVHGSWGHFGARSSGASPGLRASQASGIVSRTLSP